MPKRLIDEPNRARFPCVWNLTATDTPPLTARYATAGSALTASVMRVKSLEWAT